MSWDIFDAVLAPGDLILMITWKDSIAAQKYDDTVFPKDNARVRKSGSSVTTGSTDRREAPQYYPDASGGGASTPKVRDVRLSRDTPNWTRQVQSIGGKSMSVPATLFR